MRFTIFCTLLLAATLCSGQVHLDSKNLTNLVAIAELYSKSGSLSDTSLDPLRTPKLDHLVDTLIAAGRNDGAIFDAKFLKRPSHDELVLWYVIREIHYSRNSETRKPRPSIEVAQEILATKIDSRWLVDNYFYRIRGGIASFFNEADLSKRDINVDGMGLKSETEKAIFFLNTMEALAGGRFMVLMMTGNNKKILEFCDRLPRFNGNPYYLYKHFDYPDFDWIGYEKVESYNERHFERLYATLLAHYRAESELRDKKVADDIFRKSILNEPRYFKFSGMQKQLEILYSSKNKQPE